MNKAVSLLSSLLICFGVSGCSLAGIGGESAPETFDLVSPQITGASSRRTGAQLVVGEPTAVRALDTDRILVKPGVDRITYYGSSVWSDRLPKLVQTRLIEALANSGKFRAVGSNRDRLDGDLGLSTELRSFQIEINQGQASAFVLLYLKLIDDNGRVVASRGFSERVPSIKDDIESSVESLNQALLSVLQKVVRWAGQTQYRFVSQKN